MARPVLSIKMSSKRRAVRSSGQRVFLQGRGSRRTQLLKIFEGLYAAFGPQQWWPSEGVFETIVGAILTQNTSWGNVEKAIENLRSAECLLPEALYRIEEGRLARLLRPSGYFNIKARRLKIG